MEQNDLYHQVIEQADIVEIVSEVVSLKPKGKSFFGLCPFHADKHPSMSVSKEKKIFNCFSCGTKGNVITFFSLYNNLTIPQATIQLANKLGIKVNANYQQASENQSRLYKVMDEANNFYRFYLHNSVESKKAFEYLNKRNITKEIIDEFQIGLAPNSENALYLALKNQKIQDIDQIELGLVSEGKSGIYDLFRERIIFPIHNHFGNVVGFSGRIYLPNQKDKSKYYNSKETSIFHKGNILYNFYKASKIARTLDSIYLFEGFMDVIAAYKADIKNGIATMGTALTNEHIKAILSVTKNIILCFDGDSAGINALIKAVSAFSNFNIIPKAIILPNNLDPDEYYEKYGKDALNKELSDAPKNAYDVLFEHNLSLLNKDDVSSIENFKNQNFDFIRVIHQETSTSFYLKKIAAELNIALPIIENDYKKYLSTSVNYPRNNVSNSHYQEIDSIPKKETAQLNEKKLVLEKHHKAFKEIISYILQSSIYKKIYYDQMGNYSEYLGFKELMIYNGIISTLAHYYDEVGIGSENIQKRIDLKILDELFLDHNSKEYLICLQIMNSEKYGLDRTDKAFNDNIECLKELIKEKSIRNAYQETINSDYAQEKLTKYTVEKRKNTKIIKKG